MATEISICNLALAHLGDEATVASIDPPEGSAQATHCATFYPLARDALQELHDWGFCTTRKALALLSGDPLTGWLYAYGVPSTALKIINIFEAGATDDNSPQAFEVEALNDGTKVIYTNTESAIARYTVRVTDPSKFSPLFVEALGQLLASHLAGPVLKGKTGRAVAADCLKSAMALMGSARGSDARQRRIDAVHVAPWMAGR